MAVNVPAKIESYRDLVVWQKSMNLVVASYKLAHRLPAIELYGPNIQIRRAAVSIPANISEGFGRWHSKEFVRFLMVANGSLKELETHFLIGERLGYFTHQELQEPMAWAAEIGRMLASLRKKLEK